MLINFRETDNNTQRAYTHTSLSTCEKYIKLDIALFGAFGSFFLFFFFFASSSSSSFFFFFTEALGSFFFGSFFAAFC